MTDSDHSPPDAAAALARLDEITRRLRSECPWDREQDERSIVPHTVEEAYELADAAAAGDDAKLADELGDVLFQVHFLALLLEERGAGSLAEVADGMVAKLIRRHPHVFGEVEAESAGEVLANWDRIKHEVEGRGAGEEPFADVPELLPALLYARKVQRRAGSRLGRDGPEPEEAIAAADEAMASLDQDPHAGAPDQDPHAGAPDHDPHAGAPDHDPRSGARDALAALGALARSGASGAPTEDEPVREDVEEAVGDALFSLVEVARVLRVDPELALRAASHRFQQRFKD